jgi:hypothetical protein
MKTFTTAESIKLAATALDCGMFMPVIVKGLKKQGFNDQKIDMIIRWAQQINKKEKDNECVKA